MCASLGGAPGPPPAAAEECRRVLGRTLNGGGPSLPLRRGAGRLLPPPPRRSRQCRAEVASTTTEAAGPHLPLPSALRGVLERCLSGVGRAAQQQEQRHRRRLEEERAEYDGEMIKRDLEARMAVCRAMRLDGPDELQVGWGWGGHEAELLLEQPAVGGAGSEEGGAWVGRASEAAACSGPRRGLSCSGDGVARCRVTHES